MKVSLPPDSELTIELPDGSEVLMWHSSTARDVVITHDRRITTGATVKTTSQRLFIRSIPCPPQHPPA